jgi:PAS domain S-box-containing protein
MSQNDIQNSANDVPRILLVDDEVRNLDALESQLASPDYQIVRATTADEALMAVLKQDFATILMDVRMPSVSGIDIAGLIKHRKRSHGIPIMFLTAHSPGQADLLLGYDVGAVDYLTKPVDAKILKAKIAVFVDLFKKKRELIEAEELLKVANAELEARVSERTEKLSQANDDLQRSSDEIQERELRLRQLAAIIESSEDAILSKNLDGIITTWNHGAERLFGYKAEEVIGRPVTMLMPEDRWNESLQVMDRIQRGERIDSYETIRKSKDGRLIEISLTVSAIKDAEGKIVGVSKIIRDITTQKNAERELARAHAEIVAASRAKDDFLAALSHELRTPLNPVLLIASDAADDPELSVEVRSKFSAIRENVELEARLIDDLLDITRISHGKLSLNLEVVDINNVLKAVIEIVQAEAAQKHVRLVSHLNSGKVKTKGDPVRLQQVFWNILKNAVKFTPGGGRVEIGTEICPDEKILIHITDTGIGLTPAELKSIFQAFSQGEHATKGNPQRFGGLGLGLTISRMLIELHSGVIKASSEGRNCGSTFAIELPLLFMDPEAGTAGYKTINPRAENFANGSSAKGTRILLVEDHEPTRVTLSQLLSRRGYNVLPAMSLAEARRIASYERLDLVISDIGLPDGDGYTLMIELKQNLGLKGIALSGYGTEQDIQRGKDAGFIAHLVKPIRIESLEKILNLIFRNESTGSS